MLPNFYSNFIASCKLRLPASPFSRFFTLLIYHYTMQLWRYFFHSQKHSILNTQSLVSFELFHPRSFFLSASFFLKHSHSLSLLFKKLFHSETDLNAFRFSFRLLFCSLHQCCLLKCSLHLYMLYHLHACPLINWHFLKTLFFSNNSKPSVVIISNLIISTRYGSVFIFSSLIKLINLNYFNSCARSHQTALN